MLLVKKFAKGGLKQQLTELKSLHTRGMTVVFKVLIGSPTLYDEHNSPSLTFDNLYFIQNL